MTDGAKFQVKLSSRSSPWVRFLAKSRRIGQSDVIRELFEERLFVFGLPISVHQRLQARANEMRIPLAGFVADILYEAAMKLPAAETSLLVPGFRAPDEPDPSVPRLSKRSSSPA